MISPAIPSTEGPDHTDLLKILLKKLSLKEAVACAVEITGGNKNALYKLALGLSSEEKAP